jgi:hypothetical protein
VQQGVSVYPRDGQDGYNGSNVFGEMDWYMGSL